MKKLTLLTVSVIVLIVLSATGTGVVQSTPIKNNQENANNDKEDEKYVDPAISLTKKDLSTLKRAVKYIEDIKYKEIVEKMIALIENTGKADSNDIEEILKNSNSTIYVRFGPILGGGPGGAFCVPGLLHMLLNRVLIEFIYNGDFTPRWTTPGFVVSKGGIMSWVGRGYVQAGLTVFSRGSKGLAIGYVGLVASFVSYEYFQLVPFFSIIGMAPLIFIIKESP